MSGYKLSKLIGQVLEDNLLDEYGAIVIPRYTIITEEWVRRAAGHPIAEIPVAQAFEISRIVDAAFEAMQTLFFKTSQMARIELEFVHQNLLPPIQTLSMAADFQDLIRALRKRDLYTVEHSVAVAVLSTMFGHWLKLTDDEIRSLSMAAMLHDIGKSRVPEDILQKPGKLTDEEYTVMQRHTVFGYQLLSQTPGVTERQALVALQHHERIDGSGYPSGLVGAQTESFAKIVAIVDVFHAMTSKRVYKDAVPFYYVLSELSDGQFGAFDPAMMHVFVQRVMENLIGANVLLSDGRKARVVLLNDREPLRPLVQAGQAFIDLATTRDVKIVDATPVATR